VLVADPLPAGVTTVGNLAYDATKPEPDCAEVPTQCVELPVPGRAAPEKALTGESGETAGVAEPGERLTFTVTLTNPGATAALFDLADRLDPNTTYVADSATVDGTAREPVVSDLLVWDGIVVPAGGSVAVVYHVDVADPIPDGVTQIVNVAYDVTQPEPDCETAPLPPQCVVVNTPAPVLSLLKAGAFEDADGNGIANPGDLIRYSFTVRNEGNVPLADVVPVDAGPSFDGQPGTGALSAFTPDSVALEPGGEAVFTATYALTEPDIERGAGVTDGVENRAVAMGYAFGTAVTGTPVESAESLSVLALPASVTEISVAKVANLRAIRRGEQAPFTIRVANNGTGRVEGITVVDLMPSGFRYVADTASVNGVAVEPEVAGRELRFTELAVGAGETLEIRLRLLALSSAGPGEHVNRAVARDRGGNPLAPEARAVIEILAEHVFDCGDIVGKVFDDQNRNGYQDAGEPGLAGVRIATVKGWLITTDEHGRFHVACADLPDGRIGSNFIMKLDERTLPTGYRLTTENPRVVRLTAGKLTKLNFGAAIGRVVRLDLAGEAFVPGGVELSDAWAAGLDQLIAVLAEEQSVLRLTYLAGGPDAPLAEARVKRMKELIAERWRRRGRAYPLDIETRVEAGQ
jgi:large repetitive protein